MEIEEFIPIITNLKDYPTRGKKFQSFNPTDKELENNIQRETYANRCNFDGKQFIESFKISPMDRTKAKQHMDEHNIGDGKGKLRRSPNHHH